MPIVRAHMTNLLPSSALQSYLRSRQVNSRLRSHIIIHILGRCRNIVKRVNLVFKSPCAVNTRQIFGFDNMIYACIDAALNETENDATER